MVYVYVYVRLYCDDPIYYARMIIVIPDWSSVSQRCVRRRPYSSSRLFGLIKFLKQGTKEDQMMIGLLTNVWLQKNRTLFTIQLIIVFWGNILTMLPNQKVAPEELSSLLFSILFVSPFQESLALAKKGYILVTCLDGRRAIYTKEYTI